LFGFVEPALPVQGNAILEHRASWWTRGSAGAVARQGEVCRIEAC
jgi:hypothetical protein